MGHLYDDENVFTAQPGSDRGIWKEDIILYHADMRNVYMTRNLWVSAMSGTNTDPTVPVWHIDTGYQYVYTTSNGANLKIPICLPVGCIITAMYAYVLGTGAATGGSIDFYEHSDAGYSSTSTALDGGAANPWQVVAITSYGVAGVTLTVKPLCSYFFNLEAANNAAGPNQCNAYSVFVQYQLCDH